MFENVKSLSSKTIAVFFSACRIWLITSQEIIFTTLYFYYTLVFIDVFIYSVALSKAIGVYALCVKM